MNGPESSEFENEGHGGLARADGPFARSQVACGAPAVDLGHPEADGGIFAQLAAEEHARALKLMRRQASFGRNPEIERTAFRLTDDFDGAKTLHLRKRARRS
jgi:hypothetical protein